MLSFGSFKQMYLATECFSHLLDFQVLSPYERYVGAYRKGCKHSWVPFKFEKDIITVTEPEPSPTQPPQIDKMCKVCGQGYDLQMFVLYKAHKYKQSLKDTLKSEDLSNERSE